MKQVNIYRYSRFNVHLVRTQVRPASLQNVRLPTSQLGSPTTVRLTHSSAVLLQKLTVARLKKDSPPLSVFETST